jgi:tetratricopeptide (TPR) repeat protein
MAAPGISPARLRGERRPAKKALHLLGSAFGLLISLASAATPDQTTSPSPNTSTARELSRDAYYQIEANVFDRAQLQDAYTKINVAADRDPNEAFIYVAVSLGTLVTGYTIGDWYDIGTFSGDSVRLALAYAQQALRLDPTLSQAHAQLGRLLIIKREFAEAEKHLKTAKELEPTNFYPWAFEGISYEKQGRFNEANQAFDRAERYAVLKHQHGLVLNHRQNVALSNKDYGLVEKLYKDRIAQFPREAYAYGNYGTFLMCQGRYRDAIVQLEKAVSIAPYGRAVQLLEKAREYSRQQPTQLAQAPPKTGCG